jgi:hypothetical protein
LISGSWTVARAALTASSAGEPVSVSDMGACVSFDKGDPAAGAARGGGPLPGHLPLYGGRHRVLPGAGVTCCALRRCREARRCRSTPCRAGRFPARGGSLASAPVSEPPAPPSCATRSDWGRRRPLRRGLRRGRRRRRPRPVAGAGAVAADVHRRLAVRPGRRAGGRRGSGRRRRQRAAAGHPQHRLRRPPAPLLAPRGLLRRLGLAHWVIDETTALAVAAPDRGLARLGFLAGGATIYVVWNATTLVGRSAPGRWERRRRRRWTPSSRPRSSPCCGRGCAPAPTSRPSPGGSRSAARSSRWR